MKYLPILLVFICLNGFSQARKDSFVAVNYQPDSLDQYNINELLGVSINKFYIPATYSKYYCDVIMEEYFEGKLIGKRSIKDSVPKVGFFTLKVENYLYKDQFPVLLYSQKKDTVLNLYLRIGGAGIHSKLNLKLPSSYVWKNVYYLEAKKHSLKPGVAFPLAVYTSAIDSKKSLYGESASEFCRISGELTPYSDWYKELGIKHFFLFSILLKQ